MAPTPTREDKFSFGLWTIGWAAQDQFGGPTRAPLDVVDAIHKLSEIGAYGLTFHDDDLFAFASTDAERRHEIDRTKKALEETGVIVPMITTNLLATQFSKMVHSLATIAMCAALHFARLCETLTLQPRWAQRHLLCGAAARAPSTTTLKMLAVQWSATAKV